MGNGYRNCCSNCGKHFRGGKTPVREYDVFKNEMLNNGTSLASCASFTDELNIDIEDEWFLQEDYENEENEIWFVLHNIPAGVYTLDTKYGAEYDTKQNRTAQISVSASTNSKANKVVMEAYPLRDWKMFIGEYVYISPFSNVDELKINLDIQHSGHTTIKEMKLKEYLPARILRVLFIILAFLIVDFLLFIVPKWSSKRKEIVFILLCITLFSSYPALGKETFLGHDFAFHEGRIMSIAAEMRYGNFPVFYQSDAFGGGYGYISPLMYGSLFLYFPAILHLLGMPITIAYNIYIIFMNGLACFISFYSFKKMFNTAGWGICGTCVYMLAAYRITNLYVRAAIGEYTAMTFLPLVIYGIYRIYFTDKNKKLIDHLPLILGVSGIIQSHILTCEMLAPFVFFFGIVHIKKSIALLKKTDKGCSSDFGIKCFLFGSFFRCV